MENMGVYEIKYATDWDGDSVTLVNMKGRNRQDVRQKFKKQHPDAWVLRIKEIG